MIHVEDDADRLKITGTQAAPAAVSQMPRGGTGGGLRPISLFCDSFAGDGEESVEERE